MTIEGAIAELQNLIKADDVPFYYNGAIQKVIETIINEQPVKCKDCKHSKNCTYPAKWNWCPDGEKRTDEHTN